MVLFYIHIFGIEKFHMWSKNNFWFCLYSHFWHWKFYISTEINFWFCFIITFLTLKCYTFMFGLYMCFETTCQMILMLCVDILLWRNMESDSLEFLFHQSFVGLYLWKDQEFKIVEEVWLLYFSFLGGVILLQLFWIPAPFRDIGRCLSKPAQISKLTL